MLDKTDNESQQISNEKSGKKKEWQTPHLIMMEKALKVTSNTTPGLGTDTNTTSHNS